RPLIYSVTESGLMPLYYIDFKSMKDSKKLLKPDEELIHNKAIPQLNFINETSRYLFVNFRKDKYRRYSIYDKSRKLSQGTSSAGYYIESVGLKLPNGFYSHSENVLMTSLSA